MPVDFNDWMKTYLPDYVTTEEIYTNMCESRRVQKSDLVQLNKISTKYIKLNEDKNDKNDTI